LLKAVYLISMADLALALLAFRASESTNAF
jgi:hypothetical protein